MIDSSKESRGRAEAPVPALSLAAAAGRKCALRERGGKRERERGGRASSAPQQSLSAERGGGGTGGGVSSPDGGILLQDEDDNKRRRSRRRRVGVEVGGRRDQRLRRRKEGFFLFFFPECNRRNSPLFLSSPSAHPCLASTSPPPSILRLQSGLWRLSRRLTSVLGVLSLSLSLHVWVCSLAPAFPSFFSLLLFFLFFFLVNVLDVRASGRC